MYLPLVRTMLESAGKSQTALWSAAHNPEVAGSSPVPATRETAVFDEKAAVFITFLCTYIFIRLE